eukprot:4292278-Alexandrium_andersonii.AAC.2
MHTRTRTYARTHTWHARARALARMHTYAHMKAHARTRTRTSVRVNLNAQTRARVHAPATAHAPARAHKRAHACMCADKHKTMAGITHTASDGWRRKPRAPLQEGPVDAHEPTRRPHPPGVTDALPQPQVHCRTKPTSSPGWHCAWVKDQPTHDDQWRNDSHAPTPCCESEVLNIYLPPRDPAVRGGGPDNSPDGPNRPDSGSEAAMC